MRHDPEVLTQSKTSSSQPSSVAVRGSARAPVGRVAKEATDVRTDELLARCGIDDLDGLVERLIGVRRLLGKPTGRWVRRCVLAAVRLAVLRGWNPAQVPTALGVVAADPETVSPMRLAEAGPWWDGPAGAVVTADVVEQLDRRLEAVGVRRMTYQRIARQQLEAEGLPATRTTVYKRACQLLDSQAARPAAQG